MDGREIAKAFLAFKDSNPDTFKGNASGIYLQNRLELAFLAGISAAEQRSVNSVANTPAKQ